RQDQLLKPARHGHPQEEQPPAYRRWPSGNPRLSAFCRSAPAVRFMSFAIRFTGDFLRECAFKSRTSALDQARRLTRLARLLAICPSSAATAAMRLSIAERMRDEKQSGSAAGSSICARPYFAALYRPARVRVSDVSDRRETAALLTQFATALCTKNRILQ